MPIRKVTPADELDVVECVNDMFAHLRGKGVSQPDWSRETYQAHQRAGFDVYVWANSAAANRIDGVCLYGVQNYMRDPDTEPKPWCYIPIVCVRASRLPTTALRQNGLERAIKHAIPDAVQRWAVVGVMAEYDAKWTELHDYLASWSQAQFEDSGELERCWLRNRPGLPELTARMAGVSEDGPVRGTVR